MGTTQKSFRLSEELVREIDELARERGDDFSSTAKSLLEEAIKARRCPGTVFAFGLSGRRARIAGTGIEVWEVVARYKSSNRDQKLLEQAFHWLTPRQIKSALHYYAAYPAEIDALIAGDDQWTEETLRERHPALSPKV